MVAVEQKPILRILAGRHGIYEADVRVPPDEYERARQLTASIRPALDIIDAAIAVAFAERSMRCH